jgi:hypothetical protein
LDGFTTGRGFSQEASMLILVIEVILDKTSRVPKISAESRVVGSGITFVGVCAGVSKKDSSQVDSLILHSLVEIEDLLCQTRDVDACIALSCDVEVVSFVLRVVLEKYLKSLEIVSGCRCVVWTAVLGRGRRKAHCAWTLEVDNVCVFVPSVGVGVHHGRVFFFEVKGAILCEEAGE